MAKKSLKNRFSIDELAGLFGLRSISDFNDRLSGSDGVWAEAYDYAIRHEGLSGEEAERFASEQEEKASDELVARYVSAIENVAETLLGALDLTVTDLGSKKYDGRFLVEPKHSWRDSAKAVVELVNGVGYFHFSSLREFLDSGPYTDRQAVLSHLHVANDYAVVYGDSSYDAQRIVERQLR